MCLPRRPTASILAGLWLMLSVTTTPLWPQAQPASKPPTPPSGTMTWRFHDAAIRDIVSLMADTTGQRYILDPSVHGHITIMAHQPMDAQASAEVFLTALRTLGYTTQTQGQITRIVPMHAARHSVGNPDTTHVPNQWLVQVAPILHVSANQVAPILRPLLPEDAHIYAYGPSNSLILSGPSDDIARLMQIIHRIDVDDNRHIDIMSLHHSDANRIAMVIKQLQQADRALGKVSPVSIVADHHSNSVLLSGPTSEKLRYRILIAQLDAPSTHDNHGHTEVVYLNYLNAKSLAPMLLKVADQQSTTDTPSGTTDITSVSIQAENNTNAVVITAPHSTMASLKHVIHQLDVRPVQVAVEAIIAQVDEGTSNRLGITWGTNEQRNSDTTSDGASPSSGLGFQEGIGVIRKGNLQAVIHALHGNSATDVLATPSIVVMDNQKATLSVGKDVAVDNRTYALNNNAADTYTPFTNTEYKKVALSLTVTPQISPDGGVRLQLNQTNDTLQDPSDPGTRPVINTSQIDTTVMVRNGDILVLGGLISHDVEESTSKIPLLGDIPLLGVLFQYKKTSVVKKNLMVFLKPTLLQDEDTSVKLTQNKYDWILKQQTHHQHQEHLIQKTHKPVLPPFASQRAGYHPPILPLPFQHHD